ncbi:hypothetical protein FB481_11120 [Pseudomonas sp. AG1028]|nr:hypothetical protein FB481_11120 [Pseudomonas sp. AG1028]
MRANDGGDAIAGMARSHSIEIKRAVQSITLPFKANRPCGRF